MKILVKITLLFNLKTKDCSGMWIFIWASKFLFYKRIFLGTKLICINATLSEIFNKYAKIYVFYYILTNNNYFIFSQKKFQILGKRRQIRSLT